MDLIRRNLIFPKAVCEMVETINEDVRLRAERQDGNLRRALRTAGANAAERIALEMDAVATERFEAKTRLDQPEEIQQPMCITPKLIRDTIEEMSGLLEHAALDTQVAWVRDLFERIDVDSREEHAVAV